MASTPPAAAASVVLTAISTTASVFAAPANANWLPGLNPYQPTHSRNTPSAAIGQVVAGHGVSTCR